MYDEDTSASIKDLDKRLKRIEEMVTALNLVVHGRLGKIDKHLGIDINPLTAENEPGQGSADPQKPDIRI